MADNYKLKWSVSATPIHVDEYTIAGQQGQDPDPKTLERIIVKTSNAAQSIGGGETFIPASPTESAEICGDATYLTTTSDVVLSTIVSDLGTTEDVMFCGVQIISVADSATQTTAQVNVLISMDNGSTHPIKLNGVGSAVTLPIDAINGNQIKIKSDSSDTCNIKVLVGSN